MLIYSSIFYSDTFFLESLILFFLICNFGCICGGLGSGKDGVCLRGGRVIQRRVLETNFGSRRNENWRMNDAGGA